MSATCSQDSSPLPWASDQRLNQISPALSQAISVITSTSERNTIASSEDSHALDMYRTYHLVDCASSFSNARLFTFLSFPI